MPARAIDALTASLTADPGNHDARVRLASLLLGAGDSAAALGHCQFILNARPDNVAALDVAGRAALASGDKALSEAFVRMARALGAAQPAPVLRAAVDPESSETEHPPLQVVHGADEEAGAGPPRLRLSDVAGLENVKERLRTAFLSPMENSQLREMYRKSLSGGLLLFGPPGCGKTFIARAVAGELGVRFRAVGLADVLDMYFGQSEHNLHEVFERARRTAPCVLFFDEVDALAQRRTHVRQQGSWRGIVAQFLSEMDNLAGRNEGVFVLAATNHPWDLDTALRRPGRLDRTLLVLPPDTEARRAILEFHLRSRPVDPAIPLERLAAQTDGYSGADLAHVCESAAERALDASISTGRPRPISAGDLEAACREIRPSTAAWLQIARNFAMFANDGGVYDELLDYMHAHRIT